MLIYPAILETDIKNFWRQVKKMIKIFPYFQIDIADGKFVSNKSVTIEEILKTIKSYQSLLKNKKTEFHLMVNEYQFFLEKINSLTPFLKVEKVLIHLKALKTNGLFLPKSNFSLGIVIDPKDQIKPNWSIIKKFSTIQIMTVNPGFQGSSFLPENLKKIKELKEMKYKGTITVDGGINNKTLPIILKNKPLPDMVFVGSFLRKKPKENLAILKKILTNSC